jgi:glutathione S-transferase
MASVRPVLFRIPFSHYCQKVEWGITQAGIAYDCIDIPLHKMSRLAETTATGLVPALIHDDRLFEGSDSIMEWASNNARPGTLPLFPPGHGRQARQWQDWADQSVGPVARREAYRVAYEDPWKFTNNLAVRVAAKAAKPVVLNILKYYKARRFDEEDKLAIPQIVARLNVGLDETGTGFLTTTHATAADHSVAALARPLIYAAQSRNYHNISGWQNVEAFISRVRPRSTLKRRRRGIREDHWSELARLAKLN